VKFFRASVANLWRQCHADYFAFTLFYVGASSFGNRHYRHAVIVTVLNFQFFIRWAVK